MKNNLIKTEMNVNNNKISVIRIGNEEYISLTDLARYAVKMTQDIQYKTG